MNFGDEAGQHTHTIFTFTTMKTKARHSLRPQTSQIAFRSIVEFFHQQVNAKQFYYCIFLYVVLLWAIVIMIVGIDLVVYFDCMDTI